MRAFNQNIYGTLLPLEGSWNTKRLLLGNNMVSMVRERFERYK